jgi:hypothetical protein
MKVLTRRNAPAMAVMPVGGIFSLLYFIVRLILLLLGRAPSSDELIL